MGDTFFKDRFPFIDLDNGGSVDGLLMTVHGVLEGLPDDAKVIPGHGALATKADLYRYRNKLAQSVEIIRAAVAEGGRGLALERGLPAEFESWGSGFISAEAWIEIVYRSYGGT